MSTKTEGARDHIANALQIIHNADIGPLSARETIRVAERLRYALQALDGPPAWVHRICAWCGQPTTTCGERHGQGARK